MDDQMTIKWDQVFTHETCPKCNGDGVGDNFILDQFNDIHVSACDQCHGTGKKIDPKLYQAYVDEYNHRMRLD